MYDQYDHIQHEQLSERYQKGARWFYLIAALSLVTSVIMLLGGGWRFFLSLGVTQIIDGIATALSAELGNATKVIAIVLDIFVTAIFAAFGFLASKKQLWASWPAWSCFCSTACCRWPSSTSSESLSMALCFT